VVEYPQATIDQDLLLLTTPSAASLGNLLHGLTNSRTQKLPGRPSTMKFSLLSLLLLLLSSSLLRCSSRNCSSSVDFHSCAPSSRE
jgi:hypothetical protein